MSNQALNEIRYLLDHSSDYPSSSAVLENISQALDGAAFSPELRRERAHRRRVNSHEPEHMRQDMRCALQAALGEDISTEQREQARAIIEGIPTDREVGNHEAHAALEATLRAFGPVVLGIVLRFHIETINSMSGCSELTLSAQRMQQLGFTTAEMQWPEKVLHSCYLDAAAPENPEIEERLEKEIQSWRATYLDMAS